MVLDPFDDQHIEYMYSDEDGYITLHFYESFDDVVGAIDATWQPDSVLLLRGVFIPVFPPSPGTLGVAGICGLMASRRRR